MQIKHVKIENFKAIRKFDEDFGEITSLIGYNGGGKSSVLQAINWFFEGYTPSQEQYFASCTRTSEDVKLDYSKAMKVEITFDNLSDIDKRNFGKYARSETMTLTREATIEGINKLYGSPLIYPGFESFRNESSVINLRKGIKNILEDEYFKETLSEEQKKSIADVSVMNKKDILDFMENWENSPSNSSLLMSRSREDATHFFGVTGNSRLAQNAGWVFVPAAPDLTAQFDSTSKGSALETLLGNLVKDSLNNAVKNWQEEHQEVLSDLETRVKTESKSNLENKSKLINENLSRYLPNFEIKLDLKLSDWVPKTTPIASSEILHNKISHPIENHGHGVQRATLLALLQAISNSDRDENNQSLIVCIEEPELYQHPVQAKSIANSFLKNARNSNIQFIFATHSPYFVSPRHLDSTYRIISSDSGSEVKKASPTTYFNSQNSNGKLEKYFSKTTIEGIFSKGCLLVEGDTDEAIFKNLLTLDGITLEDKGISILNVDGAGNLLPVASIFDSFGVPVCILRDGDSDPAIAIEKSRPNNPKENILASWEGEINKFIENCVANNYLTEEEKSSFTWGEFFAGDKVLIWSHDIESILESWDDFMSEALSLGLPSSLRNSKRAGSYARVIEKMNRESYPSELIEALDKILIRFPQ